MKTRDAKQPAKPIDKPARAEAPEPKKAYRPPSLQKHEQLRKIGLGYN